MKWVIEWEAYCEGPVYSTCEAPDRIAAMEIANRRLARARYGEVKLLTLDEWFQQQKEYV